MKRLLRVCALILAAALLVSLAACGARVTTAPSAEPTESAAQTEATAAPAPPEETFEPAPSPEAPPEQEAPPEETEPPVETAPPEETTPAEEPPDPTLMSPEELAEWIDEQEGDIGAILSGLQGMELDIGHAPGEYGATVDFLPEEYGFLFPDGLREGDFVTVATDGYNVTLVGRTPADFDGLVSLAEADGYTGRKTDEIMGISVYEGYKGAYVLEMLYSAGTIEIGRGLPDW
ncbi:MAG: hypothetical protein J6P71_07860 [Oscillospiraceae bacterium]|nr:hypothetical protein [Oscillospiraceae bacterium]